MADMGLTEWRRLVNDGEVMRKRSLGLLGLRLRVFAVTEGERESMLLRLSAKCLKIVRTVLNEQFPSPYLISFMPLS